MTPPDEDLYAFLGLPETAVPQAIQEALARAEKRLSGKHGLTLSELSKRRALLLQAKRWLVPAERKEEYDRHRASPAKPAGAKAPEAMKAPAQDTIARPSSPRPSSRKPVPAIVPASAANRRSPPAAPAMTPVLDADESEEEEGKSWLTIPALIVSLAGVVVLAFVISFAVLWALSGPKQPIANAADGDSSTGTEATAPPVDSDPASAEAEQAPSSAVVRVDANDRIVLTPTSARLIGPSIRLDGAVNPPRIENWTASDAVEWEFDSPEIAIYQATLEYGMKPECEGNRFAVTVGPISVNRTVGGGAYVDGAYRDTFFLKIEKRGPTTLKIEPRDVVGGELMQFRNLTLAPRQRQAAP